MYSVFSQILCNHFAHHSKGMENLPDDLHGKILFLREHAPYTIREILFCHVITTLDYIAKEYNTWFLPYNDSDLSRLTTWICKNIVYELPLMNYKTMNVKIRIAVDMLNKIEQKGTISKELSLFYYDNIVTNVRSLWEEIVFSHNSNELPF